MNFAAVLIVAIILALAGLFLVVDAHNDLEWVYGTHGGEKCYLVGTEHKNIRYPSEPFKSYTACMNALLNQP